MRSSQSLILTLVPIGTFLSVAAGAELRDLIVNDSMPGWEIRRGETGTWLIRDGVLECTGEGKLWGGGWVSHEEYTDFILDFEYKLTPGGNSGVYVRCPQEGHPSVVAIEIQLLDDDAEKHKSLSPTQYTGSLYKIAAPSRRVSKPAGEWNRMRVSANGDHLVIALNGETVVDANAKSHPEILKRSPRGTVGFQNHHSPVWIRNIRFADLARDRAERSAWFREAKFGLFIHWGIYAVLGEGEWNMKVSRIPAAEYEKMAGRFNPEGFNAAEWVALARRAGQKYMVITSKHHDGFAMYDSKASDYDLIERTPYKRDPIKELADECLKQGVRFGLYHSILDWHHPDYVPVPDWDAAARANHAPDFNRYCESLRAQTRELCTNYGPLACWWWDGSWDHQDVEGRGRFAAINAMVRELQPHILINDRAAVPEDFDTPEQFIPPTGLTSPDGSPRLWENCITLTTGHGSHAPTAWWGYDKNETQYKTPEFCIRMLVDVVSKGGNLLLNVGPTPEGKIQPAEIAVLEAMGRWLEVNGEAIYGTTASPFRFLPFFGRAAVKGHTLYLHVFEWPRDGRLVLPGVRNAARAARLLGEADTTLRTERADADVIVHLPEQAPDPIASVIAVELDGPPQVDPFMIRPEADGTIRLPALYAEIRGQHGQRARFETAEGQVHIGNWTNANDHAAWQFSTDTAGAFDVVLVYGADKPAGGGKYQLEAASVTVDGTVQDTGGTESFKEHSVSRIELPAGTHILTVRPTTIPAGAALMNLRQVLLRPSKE